MCPSELVTATALRNTLRHFLLESAAAAIFPKFLRGHIDPNHAMSLRLSEGIDIGVTHLAFPNNKHE